MPSTLPGEMASLPPPDGALLMTVFMLKRYLHEIWKNRKVIIFFGFRNSKHLNICHSRKWFLCNFQHGFTYRSKGGHFENPALWICILYCMFYCFLLFLLYFFLSTWCHGIAHVSLNCTSVPFRVVLYRSINYIPLNPKKPMEKWRFKPPIYGLCYL